MWLSSLADQFYQVLSICVVEFALFLRVAHLVHLIVKVFATEFGGPFDKENGKQEVWKE